MQFIQNFLAKRAFNKWFATPFGQEIKKLSQEYFYGESVLAGINEEDKNERIFDLFRIFQQIEASENQFLAFREQFASTVYAYASYQVLCLKEDEKSDHPVFKDEEYVSGELYKHIQKISDKSEDLKKIKWEHDGELSDDDLIGICNFRSALYLFYVNALNLLRFELKDFSENKDWFRPFVRSMCIFAENTYRSDIDLPSLLPGSLDGLKHSTFMNIVMNGHQNPLYEFESHYSKDDEEKIAS